MKKEIEKKALQALERQTKQRPDAIEAHTRGTLTAKRQCDSRADTTRNQGENQRCNARRAPLTLQRGKGAILIGLIDSHNCI